MATVDDEQIKRRYREFLDLMPLASEIAGLPTNPGPRSYTQEQMEARAQVLMTALKLARSSVKEMLKNG